MDQGAAGVEAGSDLQGRLMISEIDRGPCIGMLGACSQPRPISCQNEFLSRLLLWTVYRRRITFYDYEPSLLLQTTDHYDNHVMELYGFLNTFSHFLFGTLFANIWISEQGANYGMGHMLSGVSMQFATALFASQYSNKILY
jgi:hypothetical protein